jgi:copper(I)-binding protein
VIAQFRTGARGWRTLGIAALAVAALVGLAGCAAGQHAQTAEETPAIDGTFTQIGLISVQAAAVVAPDKSWSKGSSAPLQLVLINSGLQNDALTGITTDAASSVAFFHNGIVVTSSASGSTTSSTESSAAATTATTGTSGASSGASSSSSGTPSAPTSSPITLPVEPTIDSISIAPGERVSIGMAAADQAIVLQNLTRDLFPADSLHLTFTFQHAGTGTLAIPVHLGQAPSNRPTLDVTPPEEDAG